MMLTKEWLLKTMAELEEERDAVPGAVNEDAAMALAAMKIALGTLEAEPIYQLVNDDWYDTDKDTYDVVVSSGARGRIVYTAPPAPVAVPDVDPRDAFEAVFPIPKYAERCGAGYCCTAYSAWGAQDFIQKWNGWNACRAAMLQGGEQTNYRAIVERIAEIIHGKVTDIDLLTVTVKSMKDKLQK
ncbi:hypothetical protein ASU91_18455 [Enterobacter hormaechei subsp. steigerwaltii]|uniref:hypothetical protein n=1 Tax=Enterobacter hormaechei TaxID=158836 RepID=UPI000695C3C5|nr:hypothetical protein [Enterobacter hormaechei]KTH37917.1 hypothetical protein ASV27_22970 [Enterobacter hormaechei subsp. steigerwaltii]KTJ07536.1 hypothetical protein ASU91_18455 [Enterobacter hormaechei subsp. steigerwaltii]HBL5341089.1 hypothetical protein [Enterobacter hormaechei]HBL9022475.1 hypothetical protein [Enterobacter hormaechei]HBL9046564.1 hypothetical protein [Enterobacter hormaechei]